MSFVLTTVATLIVAEVFVKNGIQTVPLPINTKATLRLCRSRLPRAHLRRLPSSRGRTGFRSKDPHTGSFLIISVSIQQCCEDLDSKGTNVKLEPTVCLIIYLIFRTFQGTIAVTWQSQEGKLSSARISTLGRASYVSGSQAEWIYLFGKPN